MVCNPESLSCAIWQMKPPHPAFVPSGQDMDYLCLCFPGGSPGFESHLHGLCPYLWGPTGIWQESKCFHSDFDILFHYCLESDSDSTWWPLILEYFPSGVSHLCGVCGLVVLVVGVSAQGGKETVPPDSFLSVEHLIDLGCWAHLVMQWTPEEWTYLDLLCCQAGHQETSGWGYPLL